MCVDGSVDVSVCEGMRGEGGGGCVLADVRVCV